MKNLVARELIGLSTETANALDTADEVGLILRLHASELFRGGSVFEKSCQLLIQFFFHLCQVASGLCRRLDAELARDFAQVNERVCRGGDLVVVNQALVETRAFAGAKYIAHEVEVIAVRGGVRGSVPDFVNARL